MLKKNHKILVVFAKQPWEKFTFKEIKTLSKNKSESYVYNSLKGFVKDKILIQENAGNVLLYSINKSAKASAYLGMASEHNAWDKKHIHYDDIEKLMSKIPSKYFTLIITGSYAKNKQTKGSDIDIVVISSVEPKRIYSELKHFCEINIPQIHLYVFKESEFLQMLLDKKHNYGKEIAKNNIIISGAESYYRIIIEAVKNGFNG